MKKKVNIIGAGIAGLSAGCYLQMNGYETKIFELHSIPGGLCTAWDRGGYRFDACIHWLVGSSPNDGFYNLWNELIDMKKMEFVYPEILYTFEDENGNNIKFFADIEKLENELIQKAPEDKEEISKFINAIRKITKLNLVIDKAPELMNLVDLLKLFKNILPYYKTISKWMKISYSEFSLNFKNELLQKSIYNSFHPDMVAFFLIYTLAGMHRKTNAYPIGGSLSFAKKIEDLYISLGGTIHYNSRVNKIIVENNCAKGIQLANNDQSFADIIISAADGHSTIFELLNNEYTDNNALSIYNNYQTFPSYIQVSLGISRSFDNEPGSFAIFLDNYLNIDPETNAEGISFRIFSFDPTMAQKGKTSIVSMIETKNYKYWVDLKKNNLEKYKSEKQRIANEVIEILEKRLGNIRNNVEVVDVATPSTIIRYTNNWKASFEGWVLTPKIGGFKSLNKTLKNLNNFYMIGQWVEPGGGLPSALISGRNVTQVICKKDKIKFCTQKYH